MIINRSSAWISALCLFLAIPQSHAQSPQEILARSISIETLTHYKADFEFVLPSPSMKSHGVLWGGLKADGSIRQRHEIESQYGNVKMQVTSINLNGKSFQVFPDQKRVVEAVEDPTQKQLAACLSDPENSKLEMRQEKVNEKLFYVLEMRLLEPALNKQKEVCKALNIKLPIIVRMEKWVDGESYIISQTLAYDKEGHSVSGIKYSNINTNVALVESLFEIPKDSELVSPEGNAGHMKEVVNMSITNINNRAQAPQAAKARRLPRIIGSIILLQCFGVMIWGVAKAKKKRQCLN